MKLKSEHRMILAVALSAGFFLLYYMVINPTKDVPVQTAEKAPAAQIEAESAPAANEKIETAANTTTQPDASDPQASLPVKTWTLENELIKAEFTTDGGVPNYWYIKKYHQTVDKSSPLIDLASDKSVAPLALSFEDADFSFPEKPRYEIIEADEKHIALRWRSDKVEVVKSITINSNSYLADVTVGVRNIGSTDAIKARPVLKWGGLNLPSKGGGLLGFMKQPPIESMIPVYYIDGKTERERKVAELGKLNENMGSVYWSGLESRYFLTAIIPRQQGSGISAEYGTMRSDDMPRGTTSVWAGVALPKLLVPIGDTEKAAFSAYAGPKDIDLLKAVGVNLEKAIDYGWFTIIAIPILYLLHFFHGIIHNFGIAIILLTIFVKLLLHPINIKSLKSMKAMQQLQPRLKELQAKYKDDKQRLNQETMQLFKAHKANPMGGCLPMLAQFPIYIALYKVLWNSIELFHQPFFWFYRDLSAPDPYYITPVLLGVFMAAQQKLMPSASADPAQKKMMMIMPVMFTVFMLFLPVGLVLYILVNTVMSVTQQYLYNKGIRLRDIVRGKWKPAHHMV